MKRIDLVAYRTAVVTPDTAEILRQVEQRAGALGNVRLAFAGTPLEGTGWEALVGAPGPTHLAPPLSMAGTGREVSLRAHIKDYTGHPEFRRQAEVELMWSLAVPCGLIPWLRYPVAGAGDDVFHYFGPWQMLYDSLCGEGLGEYAWPSVACASQLDVGTWEGDMVTERFVQAQLHRLGIPCGPINGEISERVLTSLRALAISGLKMDEVAEYLAKRTTYIVPLTERKQGSIVIPGRKTTAFAHGGVAASKTPNGYTLAVNGPGRIVIEIGEVEKG